MSRYTLILLDANFPDEQPVAEVLACSDDEALPAKLRAALPGIVSGPLPAKARPGRTGREVFVVHKTDEAPRDLEKVYPNAATASRDLGYKYNEVSMALARAKFAGSDQATVKGVTFQYSDTIRD